MKAYVFGHTHTWKLAEKDGIHLINLPAICAATGDIVVLHLTPSAANGNSAMSETTSKTLLPTQARRGGGYWNWHRLSIWFASRVQAKRPSPPC